MNDDTLNVALDAILPVPDRDCAMCDPSGGCPEPTECHRELAEQILAVIEREAGVAIG